MDQLKIDLFEPGMSALHRAGLGGLACTLDRIKKTNTSFPERNAETGFDDRTVTLKWEGGASGAAAFFERLYRFAFAIDDGMIYLPGAFGRIDPKLEVLAELQSGMSLTILQFGPERKVKSKEPKTRTFEVEGQPMTIQHQNLKRYKHQSAWAELVEKGKKSKGFLKPLISIVGTIGPGFIVRHNAHKELSEIKQPPGLAIALHFALVGTFSLAVDRKNGIMIVPDVQDLQEFVRQRHLLNPRDVQGCQVKSPADAALQAVLRLRGIESGRKLKLDRCQAVLFTTQTWNDKQKTRTSVLEVDADDRALDTFAVTMSIPELAPRLVLAKPEKKGDPPRKFWSKGVVRPLIAENLARGRPWYQDFRRLIVSSDGVTDEDLVRQLAYETKGLQIMIEKTPWQDEGEGVFVESIHEAMRCRFGQLGDGVDTTTALNRIDRQRQRWRLSFAGAKTADDLRSALSDLWSRSGFNSPLQKGWRTILPLICDEGRWRLNRDLALLALSSYKSNLEKKSPGDDSRAES